MKRIMSIIKICIISLMSFVVLTNVSINATTSDVNDFIGMQEAFSSEDVTEINLTDDIVMSSTLTLNKNLKINGNNHTISFGARNITLASITTESKLIVDNVEMVGTGATLINSTGANSRNWTVELSRINSIDNNISALVDFSTSANGSVIINNDLNWKTINNVGIRTRNLDVINGAKVSLTSNRVALRIESGSGAASTESINILEGSILEVYNVGNNTNANSTAMYINYASGENRVPTMNVNGAGSKLYIYSNSKDTADDGASFVLQGSQGVFNLTNGGKIEVDSPRQSGMIFQNLNGTFNVKGNDSELKITQDDDEKYGAGAALRFRLRAGQTFNVEDNAKVTIQKNSGFAPGIRFYAANNKFNVKSGAKVKITNKGDGVYRDPGNDGRNQGIHFNGANSTFNLEGELSSVEIYSSYGAAVDMESYNGIIDIKEGTVFVAHGATATAGAGSFNAARLQFSATNPLYYDFRNNSNAKAAIFNVVKSSASVTNEMASTNSNLSVWEKGKDLEDDPKRAWNVIDYKLDGNNYSNIAYTNVPDEFNTDADSYGNIGALAYSRMSGNNAAPVIDELRVPENADRYIYGHASVPEGLDFVGRDAWEDEVVVKVKQTKPDGSIEYFTGKTTSDLSIYGEEEREGMFKIDLGKLAVTGDKYEVVAAWRGAEDASDDRKHEATASDIKAGEVVVKDVTPPTPVTIEKSVYENSDKIVGNSDEVGATITIAVNGAGITGLNAEVKADGSWEIVLPNNLTLKKDDIIQVFATDSNQNKNPINNKDYHDTTFLAATKITVKEANATITGSKTVSNESRSSQEYKVGDVIEFTISYKIEQGNAYDVELSDSLPEGLEYISYTHTVNGANSENNVSITNNKVLGKYSTLSKDSQVVLKVECLIKDDAVGKSIENTANIIGDNAYEEQIFNENYSDGNTAIVEEKDQGLSVKQTVENLNGKDVYKVGDSILYTIDIKVESGNLYNVVLKDEISKDIEIEDIQVSNNSSYTTIDNKLEVNLRDLYESNEIKITVKGKIEDSENIKAISNVAVVNGKTLDNQEKSFRSNSTIFDIYKINLKSKIEDDDENNMASPNEILNFEYTIENKGSSTITVNVIENIDNIINNFSTNDLEKVNLYINGVSNGETLYDLCEGKDFVIDKNGILKLSYQLRVSKTLDVLSITKLATSLDVDEDNINNEILTGEYVTFYGDVFLDKNYNSINDDAQRIEDVAVYLIDSETNQPLYESITNSSGRYSFKLLKQSGKIEGSGQYYISIDDVSGYTLANYDSRSEDASSTSIDPDTMASRNISIANISQQKFDIGLGKDLVVNVFDDQFILAINEKQQANIAIKNGKLVNVKSKNQIVTTQLKGNNVVIKGNKEGSQLIQLEFKDRYNRETTIKNIKVTVTSETLEDSNAKKSIKCNAKKCTIVNKKVDESKKETLTPKTGGISLNIMLIFLINGVVMLIVKRRIKV